MDSAVRIENFSCYYGSNKAVDQVSIDIPKNSIYAFIGPSGCGKTTLLRSINRLNDLIPGFHQTGSITIEGRDIYSDHTRENVEKLRRGIGMIFQHPNPLPTSVMKNMLLPVKEHFKGGSEYFRKLAESKLKQAAIYEEVEQRLHKSALSLSGGQQQRLCIARALMLEPAIMLFDEPCSALDPISTYKIEEMLMEIKKVCTVIIVTHNMEQASRISEYTAFFYQGKIVESGLTPELFSRPKTELLDNYITGKF
jgi:ABC-type phosphate transport system, ATPase component